MPPTVERLDHWTVVTRDTERAKRFYTEVLGATPVAREWPPSVVFGGVTIDFFSPTGQQPEPGTLGQHHAYVIRPEDYDAWVAHLQAHDVPYLRACHGDRRMSIYVDDPDGYHIELTALFDDDERGRAEIARRGIKRYRDPDDRTVAGAASRLYG
ncbi:MAG TPA: VOC family protein [Chloroflexota bacterium]|nr:VOC family protein [Chloroflexota bacterium]